MSKTCSIQIEFYTLLPKVCRMFTTNFSSKRKPECQVIFSQDCFPLNTSPFLASLPQTLRTASALIDDGMLALTITLFMQKFPISSCKSLVCRKIFPFCRTDSLVVLPEHFFVNLPPSLQYSFSYACRWLLLNTSSLISSLIFLNRSFLHPDVASVNGCI